MPQLIFFAAIAIIAYFGYRAFIREAEKVLLRAQRVRKETTAGSAGTLVKDPKTGEYHLAKD